MTVLAILFVVALLIPIGFLVTQPAKRHRRPQQRPPADASARGTESDSPVGDIIEAALDDRANRRASSPTYTRAAPIHFRASSGRVVSFPHVRAHGTDDVAVERGGDSDGVEAVGAESIDVQAAESADHDAVESADHDASAIGDGSDVAPVSWDPIEDDSCSWGGGDDD